MAPSGSRLKTVFYCTLAVIGWYCFSSWQAFAQTKPDPAALVIGKYVGPGSCSAAACHGDVRDHLGKRAMQTEYGTWIIQDHHAKGYQTLKKQVSQRMGQILGIGDPSTSPKCLTCHALSPEIDQTERKIDLSKEKPGTPPKTFGVPSMAAQSRSTPARRGGARPGDATMVPPPLRGRRSGETRAIAVC